MSGGSLQTNSCCSAIKNKHNFPFQIIIKTRHKSEGITHLNLLQPPVVLPTQTHPHEIPNRFDTLLNINVHHLESPLGGIYTFKVRLLKEAPQNRIMSSLRLRLHLKIACLEVRFYAITLRVISFWGSNLHIIVSQRIYKTEKLIH